MGWDIHVGMEREQRCALPRCYWGMNGYGNRHGQQESQSNGVRVCVCVCVCVLKSTRKTYVCVNEHKDDVCVCVCVCVQCALSSACGR